MQCRLPKNAQRPESTSGEDGYELLNIQLNMTNRNNFIIKK